MYPEYIPLKDEHVLSAEEQPLPPVVSPTIESPGYVEESNPKKYEDDESEDGPVDYPMDRGDDGYDDDNDPFGDDTDDEDEAEEEEHLALADSVVVVPAKVEVERLLAIPTSPPSLLTSLSPPFAGELLARCMAPPAPSSQHVPSPLLPSPGCLTQIQALRLVSAQTLIDAVTLALPSPPLPPLPPPLYIPPPVDRRDDIPKTEMPPHKRSCLFDLGSRYEIGESSTARPTRGRGIDYGFVSTLDAKTRRQRIGEVGYGIRDTLVDSTVVVPEIAFMTLGEDSRTRISQRVTTDSQRVDLLMEDRIAYQETILIVEEEVYAA
uniref:Reverse transcriptase domain-containing protein n=1 Tax=Tanacetum cinerariifolium TaxID=118510 RepID=A0A6L2KSL7_TANCI|nr:hypothetical protein [Tanacetum cinerariifolium]